MKEEYDQPIGNEKSLPPQRSWKECSVGEKIERLHSRLHDLQFTLQHLIQSTTRLRDELTVYERHSHSPNGEVIVSLRDMKYRGSQLQPETKIPDTLE